MSTPKKTPKKAPKAVRPLPTISDATRRKLGLPKTPKRTRLPGEALPTTICNASMPSNKPYRTGDGDRPPAPRTGADRASQLPSRGIRA